MAESECEHRWQFLRQDTEQLYAFDRVREEKTWDYFFCERCMAVERVLYRRVEHPHDERLRYVVYQAGAD